MKLTLCLLTRNELIGCKNDIPQIKRELFDDIYAIDADSTDGTIEYLTDMGIPVYQQPRKGLNAACVYAFEKCQTDALVFFHPKGSVPVADLEKFGGYFDQGYDLVIASRNIRGAQNEEDHKLIKYRKLFVTGLAMLSALFFRKSGPIIWDVLHGFRGMTVKSFRQIAPSPEGMWIDIEMVSKAYKKRMTMIEFPTRESARLAGETHFKAIPTGWAIIKYMLREMRNPD